MPINLSHLLARTQSGWYSIFLCPEIEVHGHVCNYISAFGSYFKMTAEIWCTRREMDWCHMQTAKVQISMRSYAVWSENSLFVDIHYSVHWLCKRTTKTQMCRLIWACVVRKLHKDPFHVLGIYLYSTQMKYFDLTYHFLHIFLNKYNFLLIIYLSLEK